MLCPCCRIAAAVQSANLHLSVEHHVGVFGVSWAWPWLQVAPIVEQVRQEGDAAVRQLTERLDRVTLDDVCITTQVINVVSAVSKDLAHTQPSVCSGEVQ
eukprot:GHRR01035103.1.p1 GENE.GHRR01035103.1~~GHRR01035103.1.p1  ORF type:complete len:100 (-),score=20.11 GHRR01035103.1:231-530(-)